MTDKERFWSKVDRKGPDDCWEWMGYISDKGYGRFTIKRKSYQAHRISFEWSSGRIPDGLCIDHLCSNRRCVNPSHLEPVTNHENILRGTRLITHCNLGHPYDEKNTKITYAGYRKCRRCDVIATQKRRSIIKRLQSERDAAVAEVGRLRERLAFWANRKTIAETMAGQDPDDEWHSATPEQRIEIMGERKRKYDEEVLAARTTLAGDTSHAE